MAFLLYTPKKVLTTANYCGCSLESSTISSPQTDLYQILSQTSANSACFNNLNPETIEHVMWQCRYVQTFFNNLTNLLRDTCVHLINFKFSAMLVVFGVEHNIITDGVMDLVVLLAKVYIYRSKTIQIVPTLSSFKYILYSRYLIEKKKTCMLPTIKISNL